MHYCSLASVVALVVAAVGARRVELELNESLETDVGQEEHGKERLRGRTSDYCSDTIPYGQKLDCGEDVDLCGVLALKTGMGEDEYSHPKPMVHGLWPTVGEHGNSKCVKPSRSSEDPAALHLCYTRKGMEKQNFFFQRHEWRKHGVCAGVKDAAHYFKQVCQLAEKPLKAIEEIMKVHKDLDDIIFELQDQGICVAYQGYSSQEIMLSACRNKNGKWKLADSQDFSEVCGKKSKPNKPKKPLPVEWDFIGDEEDEGEEKGKEEDANPAPHTFAEADPQDVYDSLYSSFHKRDLPLIGQVLGADTLLLRPWTLGEEEGQREIIREMGRVGLCKLVPTFHLSKYYAELLLSGGMEPDTDSNAALFKDFVRFGSSLAEESMGSVSVAAWTVDLSLDLESLLKLPLDEKCVPEPTQDLNYLRYKVFMEILINWVRQTGKTGSVTPALAGVPLLVPLDISRASFSVRDVKDKLKGFMKCMPGWSPTLFHPPRGQSASTSMTRWLLNFALPYEEQGAGPSFFQQQLQLLAEPLVSSQVRALVMVGAQALKPDPMNVNKIVEDFGGNNATPAKQQDVLAQAFGEYGAAAREHGLFDGFLIDEWQDDWDRGGRGPTFLALDSLDAMRQVCDFGGRFSHDARRCSRKTGSGYAYPEYFGLATTHSAALQHCMAPRFHRRGRLGFPAVAPLEEEAEQPPQPPLGSGSTAGPLPMTCTMVRPSTLWVVSASVISVVVGMMIVFTGGCRCCGDRARAPEPPQENGEAAESRVGHVTIAPQEPQLSARHKIQLVSKRLRSDNEAGWWLSSHLSVQQAILEKQVMAEVAATKALNFRQGYMHRSDSDNAEVESSNDSESSRGSEAPGDGLGHSRPRRRPMPESGNELQTAMATIHRRVLEGFSAWCLYVAGAHFRIPGSVQRERLREFARRVYENEDREPALLFAEALLLRTMESLGEQMLHCPERLAFTLYNVLLEAGGGGPEPETKGRSLLFTIDFEELQGGLQEMHEHSNPYELKRLSSGLYKRGINFDDLNECGIQCRKQATKTYKEPASIMVMLDFFLCYRVPFMIKVWGLFVAGYIYLGSGSGNDLTTSHNGHWYRPMWLRLNFIQYTAMGDAILWACIELTLLLYVLWQRFPSLGYRSPGVPDCIWFLEHLGDLAISVAGFLWICMWHIFLRKPAHCWGDAPECEDPRIVRDIVFRTGMYWITRVMTFALLHKRQTPIFLHGTPWRATRAKAGRTCRAYIKNEAIVDFAWFCMLAACILVEVHILLPAMKGLNWSGACGFDFLGKVLGFPAEPTGSCSRADHLVGFDCVSCVTAVILAALLVILMGMVDIYFIFYTVSSIFGSIMGHQRHLNDLKNTSVLVDLRPREGRDAKRFEYTFGPQWRLVWMMMVRNLWEESYISPHEFVSLVEAAGLTAEGEELVDRRSKKMKPIHLARFPRLAGERLAFFFHSLKWIESPNWRGFHFEPDTDALTGAYFDPGTVPSLTQIIPAYNECVIPSADFLRAGSLPEDAMNQSPEGLAGVGDMTDPPRGSGVNTNLAFIVSQYPQEWIYLAKRLHAESQLKDPSAHQLYRNFMANKVSDEVLLEVRLWAALRTQTVYKTVIGALQYARSLAALPAVRKHYADSPKKRIPEDHVEVILAHQTFGQNPPAGSAENDEAVKLLMMRNSHSPLSLVFDLTPNSSDTTWRLVKAFLFHRGGYDGMGFQFAGVKCRWDTDLRDLRVVEVLPRKFGLRIGKGEYMTQGKAGNQLNGLRFASGHYLQALDCNMGAFIGEGFKVPYVLRTFMPLDAADRVGTRCRYLGFREHIYTGREGTVGKCHAAAEWTFGTIYQRFLSGLGTRMHYGHPDFVDGFWARNRGGMSKSSAVVNLSEDIFAGYNVRMREEASPHVDVLEFEKGREASFNAASNFFCKISAGSVAVLRSRDNHLLCERIGIIHSLSFYFTSVAFYTSNLIIDIATYLYVFLFIFFTLANIDLGRLKLLGSSFGTEWILSMGVVSIIPQLFEMVLEYGAIRAIKDVVGGFFGATWFFIFQNKSIASAMRNGAATGIAKYLSTGRPMANQHQTWKDAYISYNKSHYQPACTLLLGYIVYILLVLNTFQGKLPMMLIVISFCAWFITPVVFSPFPRLKLIKQDLVDFNGFINGRAGMGEEDLPEVIDRGSKCKVRTLFECGLSDEIAIWNDHPVFVLLLYIGIRILISSIILLALPSGITDYMWIYAVILSFSWVFVFGFFALDLNNILLIMSFLIWPCAFWVGIFVLGHRASSPSIIVRMPEYVISMLLFLYLLGLAKQVTLLACRLLYGLRKWHCPSFEQEAKRRLQGAVRMAYVYFFVHQLHCVQAYWVLVVNTVVSLLLAGVDLLPCQPHTWWLLNTELARTKPQEQYLDKQPTFLELDDQRTGYSSDTSSDEGESDTSSEADSARGLVRRP